MNKFLLALASFLVASQVQLAQAAHDRVDANTQQISCRVTKVSDGDTLWCEARKDRYKVRLFSIDAPESNQRYGKEAQKVLEALVLNQNVLLSVQDIDRYQRVVAEVFPADGKGYSFNYIMVRDGHAWAYDQFVKDRAYITAQQQAKKQRLGLWEFDKAQRPSEYRKNNK